MCESSAREYHRCALVSERRNRLLFDQSKEVLDGLAIELHECFDNDRTRRSLVGFALETV